MRATGADSVAQDLTLLAGKVGLAGVALSAMAAIKQTTQFQATMLRLQTQTGATRREMQNATKGVMNMALAVGTGPQGLATALYHIESAGFRGKTALEALRVSAEAAKIGGADLTDTTTSMLAVMVAGYAKGSNAAQQMQSAMGALNATVGAGDMTFQDLNDSLQSGILATFKGAGLGMRDFGAAMATLGDNNIRGAVAATDLRMAVTALIGPSDRAKKQMAEIGLGPLQLARDLRKPDGLLLALTDLHDHLKRLGDPALQVNALAQIVGRQRLGPVQTLIRDLDRLRSKYVAVGAGARNFGNDWDAVRHSWSFLIDQGKVLVDWLLIKLGGALETVVKQVEGLVTAFQHGRWWAVLLVSVLGGLAAALTAATVVWAGFTAATWLATAAMIAFDIACDANPIFIAIAALVALGIAFEVAWNKSRKFRDTMREIWFQIRLTAVNAVNGVIHAIDNLINGLNAIKWGSVKVFGHTIIPGWGGFQIGTIHPLGRPHDPNAPGPAPGPPPSPGVSRPGHQPGSAPGESIFASRVVTRRHSGGTPLGIGGGTFHIADLDEAVARGVKKGMHEAPVYLDGQQVGKMLVRQGNLQRARQ
jgi:TP901 family phage tail tape measure protein